MILVGVEAGFTTVRATAFDTGGGIIAATARPITPSTPQPGWLELDQTSWFAAAGQAIQELRPKLPAPPELLCLTAPTDGLWLAGASEEPVRPAILPADRRATELVAAWDELGIMHAVYRRGGYALLPGGQAALLRWMLDHQPDALGNAHTALYAKDALLHQLTGARITDLTDASAPFLDLRSRAYDEELIDLLRLRQVRNLLPNLDSPTGSLWPLSARGAASTGLPEGMPVHAGPFDAIATGLGSGLQGAGDAFILLGPQLATGIQIDRLDLSAEPAGRTVCLPRYDRWVRLLTSPSGMTLLDWLLPLIGVTFTDLDAILQRVPPGAHGVQILPPFSDAGETAPRVDPGARGRIVGLTTNTSKDDLARAACEGLALSARHSLSTSGLLPGVITLAGGGSRAPAFRQLLADTLDAPIHVAPQPETAARGAVIAGMIAADIPYDHVVWTAPTAEVIPNPTSAAHYHRLYARYLEELSAARSIT